MAAPAGSVYFYELPVDSGNFDVGYTGSQIVKKFFLAGLADESLAEVYAQSHTPSIYRRLLRQKIKGQRIGPAEWFIDIEYGTLPAGEFPDLSQFGPSFSGDTTGQSVHITQSLGTISKTTNITTEYGANSDNPVRIFGIDVPAKPKFTLDNEKAIGLSMERVEGCEKFVPQFQWQTEISLRIATGAYLVTLMNQTGTTNIQPFCSFPPRSTLFLGASFRYTDKDRWRFTFKFSSMPNRVNIDIGNGITVPFKAGWDYLWVGYQPKQVGTKILQVPNAAYVEQIYHASDFFNLGIGGCKPFFPPKPPKKAQPGVNQNKNVGAAFGKRIVDGGVDDQGNLFDIFAAGGLVQINPDPGPRGDGAGPR